MGKPSGSLVRTALIATAVGVAIAVSHAQDRPGSAESWQAAWEARQAREAERRRVESLRRAYEFRRALAHARLRSEGDVGVAMRASTPPAAEAMCPVLSSPDARRGVRPRNSPAPWAGVSTGHGSTAPDRTPVPAGDEAEQDRLRRRRFPRHVRERARRLHRGVRRRFGFGFIRVGVGSRGPAVPVGVRRAWAVRASRG